MPLAKATAKLTANGTAPTAATFTAMWRPSTRAAPAITGIASRKLNSAAAVGPRPDHNAAHTVEPERDTPRNTAATAWAKPIPTAAPTDGWARSPPPNRRVDQFMNPVTRNPAPTNTSEAAASTCRWNTTPITPAGSVASARSPAMRRSSGRLATTPRTIDHNRPPYTTRTEPNVATWRATSTNTPGV